MSTITKGLIGEQDLNHWDGGPVTTFSRPTSSGGTMTLNKIGYEVDALMAFGGGSSLTDATLRAAVDAIGSNDVVLVLRSGAWAIASDLTIPSNITLRCLPGAILTVSTAKTLTISGDIDAGNHQIFDYAGTGSITFTTGASLKSAWFSSLTAAVALISAVSVELAVTKSESISADLTVAATTSIKCTKGYLLTIATTKTLTINGPFEAGLYQVFSCTGTGTVILGGGTVTEISPSWFGFSESATAAVNKTAIDLAVTALGSSKGGLIKFPKGSFPVAPEIKPGKTNVTFEGSGSSYGYEGTTPGTILVFTAGTYGFDFTEGATGTTANYCKIKNIKINGNSVLANGVGIKSAKLIEDVDVIGCTNAGIYIVDYLNSTHITRTNLSYNSGWGLLIEGSNNTTASFSEINVRQNTSGGIKITGGSGLSFDNSVVESNTGVGLYIYKPTGGTLNHITFNNVWFENNSDGTTGYQITIDSQTHDYSSGPPAYINFKYCNINAAGSEKGVLVTSARGVDFDTCNGLGGDTAHAVDLTTYASYVTFKDWNGGTIVNGGNRSFTYTTKTAGSSGFQISADLHATGGRTQTLWFTNSAAITAGSTTYLLPIHSLSADNRTYPLFASGSIVGIVVSKNVAATGTLVFTPFYQIHWAGAKYDLTTTATLATGTTHVEATATIEADTFADTDTTGNEKNIGIKVVASNPYIEGADSKIIVGLVVEY
jgi:hypothetical protein